MLTPEQRAAAARELSGADLTELAQQLHRIFGRYAWVNADRTWWEDRARQFLRKGGTLPLVRWEVVRDG